MKTIKQLKKELHQLYYKYLKNFPTKAEIKLRDYLKLKKVKFIFQKKIKWFFYDFWIKSNNLLVEVDGEYHNTTKQKARDREKESLATKLGYHFLRIKNKEVFNNIQKVFLKIINFKK